MRLAFGIFALFLNVLVLGAILYFWAQSAAPVTQALRYCFDVTIMMALSGLIPSFSKSIRCIIVELKS